MNALRGGDLFAEHRKRMDEMRRRQRRQARVVACIFIAVIGAALLGSIWLVTHPEAIGRFFGGVAAGFSQVGGTA